MMIRVDIDNFPKLALAEQMQLKDYVSAVFREIFLPVDTNRISYIEVSDRGAHIALDVQVVTTKSNPIYETYMFSTYLRPPEFLRKRLADGTEAETHSANQTEGSDDHSGVSNTCEGRQGPCCC